MKKVYYKGQPYEYKVTGNVPGKRQFQLFSNGILTHFVQEHELDKKSVVSLVLEEYYVNLAGKVRNTVLQ